LKLISRQPGSVVRFIDSSSDEVLLQIGVDEKGGISVGYRLHDRGGALVAQSVGDEPFSGGMCITGDDGELLLDLPVDHSMHLQYRLYNSAGRLITCSDGERTQIPGPLKMEAVGRYSSGSRGKA
jgi:hypothetical protein